MTFSHDALSYHSCARRCDPGGRCFVGIRADQWPFWKAYVAEFMKELPAQI